MILLVFNINEKTPRKKERLKSSVNWDETLINDLRILFGILFGPIAFEGLRNNIIFLTSISSVGLRKKQFINPITTSLFNTTFTLEPTITDLKLIWICFKTSRNDIYLFPTVSTRLWKRNNDCFQFSCLHLSMIIVSARWSMICLKCCKDVWNL